MALVFCLSKDGPKILHIGGICLHFLKALWGPFSVVLFSVLCKSTHMTNLF